MSSAASADPLSPFHPAVRQWFQRTLGTPTTPQAQGWPLIRAGNNVLIAAPTGSGKTLTAFLTAIDQLAAQGPYLPGTTQVLYLSPLKALSNDIEKNLRVPLDGIRTEDPFLPEIRVAVRTGDTPASERAKMLRRPPHILVSTPESLYILLTSVNGRKMLRTVKTVIVDEVHALTPDKRGAHLSLSLERLEALAGKFQRIGLSGTQKPLAAAAGFLGGFGREVEIVDAGHVRERDLDLVLPGSPLEAVCSHEVWSELYEKMAELILAHRTTLIFVNTRKMAERLAARLSDRLGEKEVACHHGSLSRSRRLEAEQRLKEGKLRVLVATASLELGIDIGDVELVLQLASPRAITTFLQRAGRAGHGPGRVPKARLIPLTRDELVEAAALLRCIKAGELDAVLQPEHPLDILAQQLVAECVHELWEEDQLYETFTRAWPYRNLSREDFDATVALHTEGRHALLHRDGVRGRLRATKRARMTAVMCGGAIPDAGDYQVLLEPEGTLVGTLNEDFAIESNAGDVFQLGNTSWRILRVEPGKVRVADARGQPPSIPFWIGEGASRTIELSQAVGRMREVPIRADEQLIPPSARQQIAEYIETGKAVLGAVPSQTCVIAERFFDESGGMQLVLHAPFGGRINRAWGLALRKRFCRGFGFELQAAASEEALLISLGPHHSFPLESVFEFLHPNTAQELLVQALLDQPMFETRWRWNATRSLLVERMKQGKRVGAPLQRMRSADLLVASFPQALACPETLPPGDLPVPYEHPLVRQTITDCLTEKMDVEGFLDVLRGLRDGRIKKIAVDTPEPSVFAQGILSAQPYMFLDDAPLEERRAQAVIQRRGLPEKTADEIGALDPAAVARVKDEAWPVPENAEEVHEALSWMGFVTAGEARAHHWTHWLEELRTQGRVSLEDTESSSTSHDVGATGALARGTFAHSNARWMATEFPREPKLIWRGRLEAVGPVFIGEHNTAGEPEPELSTLLELEKDGLVLRTRIEGRPAWCQRRLLARIHRYTLETLRKEIEPATTAQYLRFLSCWQHADSAHKMDGPRGVAEVLRQLAGFEIPAHAWESAVLPMRVRGYRHEWLDQLTLSGEFVWARLWVESKKESTPAENHAALPVQAGPRRGTYPARLAPLTLLPRDELEQWMALARLRGAPDTQALGGYAKVIYQKLATGGALFTQELARQAGLLSAQIEEGLGELATRGLAACDSFAGLRALLVAPSKRRHPFAAGANKAGERKVEPAFIPGGRWSLLRGPALETALPVSDKYPKPRHSAAEEIPQEMIELVAWQLLRRTGVVFRKTVWREKFPVPWYALLRVFRRWELSGKVRGGRFVAGFDGEQYALPEAVSLLREIRRRPSVSAQEALQVSAADPLNFQGILSPGPRIAPATRTKVDVG